jgi:pseudouridine-5'-monophosphatase
MGADMRTPDGPAPPSRVASSAAPSLAGIDAVIFDMDGVLLDTEKLYTQATQEILAPYGKQFDWATKARMMGRAPLVSAQVLIEATELPLSPEEFLAAKKPLLERLFPTCEPMPGAIELVERLSQRGMPLAVATSSERHYFEAKTRHHPWFSSFRVVVCGSDPEVGRHKPAPDIFLVAAERLGVRPESCLVFEDSVAGVEAARAAGMKVAAVPAPQADKNHYELAHYVLATLVDVLC